VAGFLGSHLADAFWRTGHEVVANDNMIGAISTHVPESVEFRAIRLQRLRQAQEHMAGVDHRLPLRRRRPMKACRLLADMITQNIVRAPSTAMVSAAIASGVRRFVMCSSMARYGTNQVPFREDMTPRRRILIGIGKYAAELMLQNLAETHGWSGVVAVPHKHHRPASEVYESRHR
jgi:UDP-glucose 4-epimerase